MKIFTLKLLTLFSLAVAQNQNSIQNENERRQRLFSIFSVVNFPNSQCTTLSSANTKSIMFGTCQSSDSCISLGGTADGNCASGFGVCCMISTSTCGSTISQNLTYIQNPGFPSAFSTTGTCSYILNATPDICQIRLDFDNFVVSPPDTVAATFGSCSTAVAVDRIVFTSPSGYAPPTLCGTLTGSHMYIETARTSTSAARLDITLGTPAPAGVTRTWKIRTQFIECDNPMRAPTDCVQYFTGVSGRFTSYNINAAVPQVIAGENYNYCFRQEEGYCTMDVYQTGLFSLQGTGPAAKRLTCTDTYLNIRSNIVPYPVPAFSNSDTYCGIYLNQFAGARSSGAVPVTTLPFVIGFFAKAAPASAPGTTPAANLPGTPGGFSLDFMQVPC